MDVLMECINVHVKKIYFLFTCVGGNLVNGIYLYNFIRNMSCETVMHNIGEVDSIGTLIFLAAKERYATKNSIFLFHGMQHDTRSVSNPVYDEKIMGIAYKNILNQQERLLNEYTQNTLLTEKEVSMFFLGDTIISSDDALKKGIITQICDFKIEANAPFISIPQRGFMQE